jgi:hypothetical protein
LHWKNRREQRRFRPSLTRQVDHQSQLAQCGVPGGFQRAILDTCSCEQESKKRARKQEKTGKQEKQSSSLGLAFSAKKTIKMDATKEAAMRREVSIRPQANADRAAEGDAEATSGDRHPL